MGRGLPLPYPTLGNSPQNPLKPTENPTSPILKLKHPVLKSKNLVLKLTKSIKNRPKSIENRPRKPSWSFWGSKAAPCWALFDFSALLWPVRHPKMSPNVPEARQDDTKGLQNRKKNIFRSTFSKIVFLKRFSSQFSLILMLPWQEKPWFLLIGAVFWVFFQKRDFLQKSWF